ncbi:MAG: type II secretion system F family protein [Candidatus Nanopelagicaceae bacterium]|jgi:Flp pilus assembly protein TadB|nr:type II secretion system F family protein [Candidatus Nanopelagicaceae bacterium]
MDGESRSSASQSEGSALIENFLSNHQLLSLLVVSPILMWGIWIISEESFDGINAADKLDMKIIEELRTSLITNRKGLGISLTRNRTRNRNGIRGESDLELVEKSLDSARSRRLTFLPIYFGGLTLCTFLIYCLVFVQPRLIKPSISLLGLLVLLFVLMKRKRASQEKYLLEEFDGELPTQIQLLTVLISSGISPARAIALLSMRSESISCHKFAEVVQGIEDGESVVEALDKLVQRNQSLVLRRFITSLILGIERGSSLTPILISQVRDSRLASKSETMKRAGKAEIALLIPVVFLILPISILFALWPSYQQLGSFL